MNKNPMTSPQANRADPRIGVFADPDAPGNWWVYQRRNQRCAQSLPPMTRAEFKALVRHLVDGTEFPITAIPSR